MVGAFSTIVTQEIHIEGCLENLKIEGRLREVGVDGMLLMWVLEE
jgi:hypothetical protein